MSRAKRSHTEIDAVTTQLLVTSQKLQNCLGTKYCADESELLRLLFLKGVVRCVRTVDIEIQPLGGDSFKVTLNAEKPSVGEAKSEIARALGRPGAQQHLYKVASKKDGTVVREDDAEPMDLADENTMLSNGELLALAVSEGPPIIWKSYPKDRVVLSEGGAVATQTANCWSLCTSDKELTHGTHYWEVELLSESMLATAVGVSRPNLDPTDWYGEQSSTDGWFMCATCGALHGNGKVYGDAAGTFKQGDRIGVQLDLDDGSLKFYRNDVQHGPGYPAGSVTGPVIHAVQMYWETKLRLVPNEQRVQ
jgi:hypothetical protein